jgi:dual specificity phosphatase 12
MSCLTKNEEESFFSVRSKAQEIRPNLYLTNYFFAKSKSNLININCSHVLVCGFELPTKFEKLFKYRKIDLSDNPGSDILSVMPETLQFMYQAIINGGTLVVHCAAGQSRSVAFVMAYLIVVDQVKTVDNALKLVRVKRPHVNPNFGFLEQLQVIVDNGCGWKPPPPPTTTTTTTTTTTIPPTLIPQKEIVEQKETSLDIAKENLPPYCCVILQEEETGALLMEDRINAKVASGKLCCFGGKRELHENPLQCIMREVKEELGVEFNSKFFIRSVDLYVDNELIAYFYTYPSLSSEITALFIYEEGRNGVWLNYDDDTSLENISRISPWHQCVLDAWRKKLTRANFTTGSPAICTTSNANPDDSCNNANDVTCTSNSIAN